MILRNTTTNAIHLAFVNQGVWLPASSTLEINNDFAFNESVLAGVTAGYFVIDSMATTEPGYMVRFEPVENTAYDNATSGLTATDTQAAIDEVEGRVDTLETSVPASNVTYDNSTSGLTATDAQGAIDELDSTLDNLNGTSVAFTNTGTNLSASTASAAILETDTRSLQDLGYIYISDVKDCSLGLPVRTGSKNFYLVSVGGGTAVQNDILFDTTINGTETMTIIPLRNKRIVVFSSAVSTYIAGVPYYYDTVSSTFLPQDSYAVSGDGTALSFTDISNVYYRQFNSTAVTVTLAPADYELSTIGRMRTNLSIVGDIRPLAGASWTTGSTITSTMPGAGTGVVTVTPLVAALTVTATGTNPDFTGWVSGDKFYLTASDGAAWHTDEFTIDNVVGNVITATADMGRVAGGPCMLTLVPNVSHDGQVTANQPKDVTITVQGAKLVNTTLGATSIVNGSSPLVFKNCVFIGSALANAIDVGDHGSIEFSGSENSICTGVNGVRALNDCKVSGVLNSQGLTTGTMFVGSNSSVLLCDNSVCVQSLNVAEIDNNATGSFNGLYAQTEVLLSTGITQNGGSVVECTAGNILKYATSYLTTTNLCYTDVTGTTITDSGAASIDAATFCVKVGP